nr:hypothetical protein [Pseudonocardia sp. AL041005-10]
MGDAAERWRERQTGRGIPDHVLRHAAADPWAHDPADFTPPAEPADTPSHRAARAIAERAAAWTCAGASVLDVGCGGGDAAFGAAWPEPSPVARVVGVDRQADMLAVFAAAARAGTCPTAPCTGAGPTRPGTPDGTTSSSATTCCTTSSTCPRSSPR